MAHATPSDYFDVFDAVPDGISRTLDVASRRVDEMVMTAVYDVDDDGLPTDADVTAALMLATVEQAAWMRGTGDASGVGANGQFQSFTIGSLSASRGSSGSSQPSRFSPEAFSVLQQAGLTGQSPIVP